MDLSPCYHTTGQWFDKKLHKTLVKKDSKLEGETQITSILKRKFWGIFFFDIKRINALAIKDIAQGTPWIMYVTYYFQYLEIWESTLGEPKIAFRISARNPLGKMLFGSLRRKWADNTKINLKKMVFGNGSWLQSFRKDVCDTNVLNIRPMLPQI